ncbi:2-hydroxymuconic semialdehyde dehydrogenase [Polymorphobacter sp.]|uniref:2-hydroxymuconic semialdehyde dehydrogenase n=1 Tax=Polymorphobacter sp. TaxID=1909290 RepID=UPI003F714936
MAVLRNFIGGRFVDGGARFEDVNPATGAVIAEVCEADAEIVDAAVSAARAAMDGDWGQSHAEARARMMERIADGIEARADEFVAAEVADTGRPIAVAEALDVARGAANFRAFAAMARAEGGESFETPGGGVNPRGAVNYSIRRPLGVVAAICPWNLPLLSMSWKVAPALACGNAVVAKPSEETPATATLLAEVMASVGVPDGVFNLVHGFGEGSAGGFMTAHSQVDAISFTGETATGEAIMRQAAKGVRPVSFELGGKNPAIVFADCDFEAAVAGVARSSFFNSGQVCLCTERVYVERGIYEQFVAALVRAVDAYVIGDPLDRATTMGPLTSETHRTRVLGYFEVARGEGAEVLTGGGVPDLAGAYVLPTVWAGLSNSARILQEEVFGPVCHVMPFDGEDEAVALANDTKFGLAASIWTRDVGRAARVAGQVKVGLTWVNCWFLRDLRTPFGGSGLSGIGREGGRHSFDFYSETRNVCLAL